RQGVALADAAEGQRATPGPAHGTEADALALVVEAAKRLVAADQHVMPLRPPGDLLEVLRSDQPAVRVARLCQHQQPRSPQGPVHLIKAETQPAVLDMRAKPADTGTASPQGQREQRRGRVEQDDAVAAVDEGVEERVKGPGGPSGDENLVNGADRNFVVD